MTPFMTPDIIDSWLAIRKISELLTIMIETRFLDLIVGNYLFQSIFWLNQPQQHDRDKV